MQSDTHQLTRKHEGFRVEKRTAIVDFAEDSPWHGVEAKVITSVPFETLFWFQRNAEKTDVETSAEALAVFGDDFLIEWNLCDSNDEPYPSTGEGVCRVDDSSLIALLMSGWIEAVVHPPIPLSARYNGSPLSEEDTIEKLAKLSQNHGN